MFKQKGDMDSGIRLTEHLLKVLGGIVDETIRATVKIGEHQYGFIRGEIQLSLSL